MKKAYMLLFGLLWLAGFTLTAQFRSLLSFNVTNGAENEYSTVLVSNGIIYGVTSIGGAHDSGTVFALDTNGGGYRDLHDFSGADGYFPTGSLVLSGNVLFGVTALGGINDSGSIFSIHTDGTHFKDIFDFNGTNGQEPVATLTLSGSTLYGTALLGGLLNLGCIFSVDTDGTGYVDLHDFIGPNGRNPYGSVTLSGNKLYGATNGGGSMDSGCIYSININGSGYADIFDFTGLNTGRSPFGGLTLVGGTLYGTAAYGGLLELGCIFSVDTDGSGFTDMHDFIGVSGAVSGSTLALSGNTLLGMTAEGGVHDSGCIFAIQTNGGGYKDLYDFNSAGYDPQVNSLTVDGEMIYGIVPFGGTSGDGTLFAYKDPVLSVNTIQASERTASIYPNPCNGQFTVKLSGGYYTPSTLEIYNILGQPIFSEIVNPVQSTNYVDLSSQAGGIYLYRITNSNGSLISDGKIVIEK
jgi:uncharacterized repeat protein (TIGR03803 family)